MICMYFKHLCLQTINFMPLSGMAFLIPIRFAIVKESGQNPSWILPAFFSNAEVHIEMLW